jgi:uncharacterized membrane protein YheB (UPF0754 family)
VINLTLNKSFLTNLIAFTIAVIGYFSPYYEEFLFTIGLFALSGSLTNWLAIHMLFNKVPFLYGSGVIPNQFEEFKTGIKHLLISEFFTRENVESFISQSSDALAVDIKDRIDFNHVFNSLIEAIEGSSVGGMIDMFGGKKVLEPLREPMIGKLEGIVVELLETEQQNNNDLYVSSKLMEQIEQIIDRRLQQLTPEQVRVIVQNMIGKHLGWLVVWGGIFGSLIGCLVALV